MALPRCQQQPLVSLDPILRHAVAPFVADGQIVLRIGVILLGGFAVPFRASADPSPRLRPCRSEDRVPPRTLRRLLLPSPSLPQTVFDRPWFVARPIERQRHSTPTEA
jgi:hypothetical protein